MAFNKSNWLRTGSAEKARVYVPAGIPNSSIGGAGTAVITVTVPFQFQGSGQVEVGIPAGQPALNTGLSLGESTLLAPASGSYSAGNHPRVQFKVANSTAGGITPANTDVTLVQY